MRRLNKHLCQNKLVHPLLAKHFEMGEACILKTKVCGRSHVQKTANLYFDIEASCKIDGSKCAQSSYWMRPPLTLKGRFTTTNLRRKMQAVT